MRSTATRRLPASSNALHAPSALKGGKGSRLSPVKPKVPPPEKSEAQLAEEARSPPSLFLTVCQELPRDADCLRLNSGCSRKASTCGGSYGSTCLEVQAVVRFAPSCCIMRVEIITPILNLPYSRPSFASHSRPTFCSPAATAGSNRFVPSMRLPSASSSNSQHALK